MNDAMAGQVDARIDNLPSSLPHIEAGKLKALALMSDGRVDVMPPVRWTVAAGLVPHRRGDDRTALQADRSLVGPAAALRARLERAAQQPPRADHDREEHHREVIRFAQHVR